MPKNSIPSATGETEHDDQVRIFQWAELATSRYPQLVLLYAVPNGAKLPWKHNQNGARFSPEAMKLKAEGLKSGVPDICLPYPVNNYHGFYLELKHGKNKPSEEQLSWISALRSVGNCVVIEWGWENAIKAISDYLEGRL